MFICKTCALGPGITYPVDEPPGFAELVPVYQCDPLGNVISFVEETPLLCCKTCTRLRRPVAILLFPDVIPERFRIEIEWARKPVTASVVDSETL